MLESVSRSMNSSPPPPPPGPPRRNLSLTSTPRRPLRGDISVELGVAALAAVPAFGGYLGNGRGLPMW